MHTNNQQHYQQELGENTHKLESKYPNHAHLQLEGINKFDKHFNR